MSEFYPAWEIDPANYTLPVSNTAARVLVLDCAQSGIDDYHDQINNELLDSDPLLHTALERLVTELDIVGLRMDYFSDGFLLGYKLLANEAAITGTPLPELSFEAYDYYATTMLVQWQKDLCNYQEDRETYLSTENENYWEGLQAAIPEDKHLSEQEISNFVLGGIMLHDLLLLQKCGDSFYESQLESAPEQRALEERVLSAEETATMRERRLLTQDRDREAQQVLMQSLIAAYLRGADETSIPMYQ